MADLITVRYYAGARSATGLEQEELPASRPWPLEELARHLAERHGAALERILVAASFLVDETAGPRDRLVAAGSVVDVLPPFAGG